MLPCWCRDELCLVSFRHDARHSISVSSHQNFVSRAPRVLQVALGKLQVGCHAFFYWGVTSIWPPYQTGLIGGVLQKWLFFKKVLLFLRSDAGARSEWPLGSCSPPWLKPLSLIPILDDGGRCAHWDLFCTRPQICARYNPVSAVYRQLLGLHGLVCAPTCSYGTLYRQACGFLNLSNQPDLETSDRWSVETGCTKAHFWASWSVKTVWIPCISHKQQMKSLLFEVIGGDDYTQASQTQERDECSVIWNKWDRESRLKCFSHVSLFLSSNLLSSLVTDTSEWLHLFLHLSALMASCLLFPC